MKFCHVKFIQTTNKIPWKKIKSRFGGNVEDILCKQNVYLPIEYGFSRYNSIFFMRRLCENAALVALEKAKVNKTKLKISLYDPRCAHHDMAELLLPYCCELKIITNNVSFYEKEVFRLNQEYDTPICVSDLACNIYPCNVIVSPDKIKKKLKMDSTTIVFTSEKPVVKLDGLVYDDYKVALPKRFKELECLDLKNEYLLSALYDKENDYQLGSIVPNYCGVNGNMVSLQKVSKNIKQLSNQLRWTTSRR